MDHRGAPIRYRVLRYRKQFGEHGTTKYLPEFEQFDFSQDLMLDQYAPQRFLLLQDFSFGAVRDPMQMQTHDPVLHDLTNLLRSKQDLPAVVLAMRSRSQYLDIDRISAK